MFFTLCKLCLCCVLNLPSCLLILIVLYCCFYELLPPREREKERETLMPSTTDRLVNHKSSPGRSCDIHLFCFTSCLLSLNGLENKLICPPSLWYLAIDRHTGWDSMWSLHFSSDDPLRFEHSRHESITFQPQVDVLSLIWSWYKISYHIHWLLIHWSWAVHRHVQSANSRRREGGLAPQNEVLHAYFVVEEFIVFPSDNTDIWQVFPTMCYTWTETVAGFWTRRSAGTWNYCLRHYRFLVCCYI